MFAVRRFIVVYRLFLAVLLIGLGIYLGIRGNWWQPILPILVGLLMVVAHFMVGPMSLMQHYVESGEVEEAQKLLAKVKYPKFLYKPIRSAYYMMKANFSTMSDDLDGAEAELRKSLESGTSDKESQGIALYQLGVISYRKGNMRDAYEHLRKSVQLGLPDADNTANAYLQLSSICMQRRDYKGSKFYYAKAVAAKATNPQIKEQLAEMKKYISRIPG